MSDVDGLVKVFQWLRNDVGLTAEKLELTDGRDLLDLLTPTGSGEVGLHVLDELIGKMLDRSQAWAMRDVAGVKVKKHLIPRAVRVALAVGSDDEGAPLKDHGILTARRDWACQDSESAYFMDADPMTHKRYEDRGFRILARLVIAHAENASLSDAADRELARANQAVPFTPADLIDVNAAPSSVASPPGDEADQASTDEEQPNHDDAPEPVEPAEQAPAGRRAKMRAFYYQYLTTATPGSVKPMSRTEKVIFSGIAVTIVTLSVLMLIGIVPTSLYHHSSSTSTQPGTALVSPNESNDTTWVWGPDRTFYTMKNPAHSPVINSISDLPDYGNEQDFFICWDLTDPNANNGERGNLLAAVDQHTYRCQLLYDNAAAPGFDHLPSPSQAVNPMAMLQNTRARVQFPDRSTKNAELWGFVTATNTYPNEVHDSVIFTSTKPVTLTYVSGSARLLIGGGVTPNGGAQLTDDAALIGDGALVGDHQDGFVDQNPGYIQFEVTVTLG